MYYFVEYLRARGAIKVALIILGLFVIAAIILRLSVHAPRVSDIAYNIETSPTAHVTRTHLPDGSMRTVVDDPARQTHAVIVQNGNRLHMDVREPAKNARATHDTMDIGSTSVNTDVHDGVEHTVIDSKGAFEYELGVCLLITIPMGLLVATLLAGPLAKENDGHLELAWTKPTSRDRYALEAIAVDAVAILASQALTLAILLLVTLMFFVPHFTYGPRIGWIVLLALLGPLAWYAALTACSASVKRGPGMVIGLGWVFAIIIPTVADATSDPARFSAIAAFFYTIFHSLSFLDPIAYLSGHTGTGNALHHLPLPTADAGLAALIIGYVALSVLQWRRVEA
jgi:hypothetical protein